LALDVVAGEFAMRHFRCSDCGASLAAKDEFVGKRIRCPKCSSVQTVPEAPDTRIAARPEGGPKKAPAVAARKTSDRADTSPRSKPRAAKSKTKSLVPLLMVFGIAGAAIVVTGGVLLGAYLLFKNTDVPQVVELPIQPKPVPKNQVAPVATKPATAKTPAPKPAPKVFVEAPAPPPDPPVIDLVPGPRDAAPPVQPAPAQPGPAQPAPDQQAVEDLQGSRFQIARIKLDFEVPVLNKQQEAEREKAWLDFNLKTTVGAFEKIGKKNPKWNKAVLAALDGGARVFTSAKYYNGYNFQKLYPFTKEAIDAGCDDPLVLYLHARSTPYGLRDGQFTADDENRIIAAAWAMEKSKYPAFRRLVALNYGLGALRRLKLDSEPAQKEFQRMFAAFLDQLHQTAREGGGDPRIKDFIYIYTVELHRWRMQQLKNGETTLAWVEEQLKSTPALEWARLQWRGEFYLSFAWQARGNGYASEVTEDGFRLFGERLQESGRCLESAWKMNPSSGPAAATMLTVTKGLGGDYDTMKTWFARAMQADPYNLLACQNMMDYLDPKWGGSQEKLLAFGRACRASGNIVSGITTLIGDAHIRAVTAWPKDAHDEYMHSEEVWKEIKGAFDEHFARVGIRNSYEGCRHAVFCYLCGKYDLAKEQFDILGDNLHSTQIFPIEFVRQIRAAVGAKK
jgi:DNA-directed RNA polymerase subunit RPC12/RpoP